MKMRLTVLLAFAAAFASAEDPGLETKAWQSAIDEAARGGGGVVTIPPGQHVTGQLYLRNNVELRLDEGAVLEGAPGLHNYVVHYLPFSEGTWSAVVVGIGVTNVAITGKGMIFGNGKSFPKVRAVGGCDEGFRPRGVFFADSEQIRLEDFRLYDAACWGIVLKRCSGVTARRVQVNSVANVNNDGFDVEAKNVLIEDCDVESGDDGYCIKSNDPGFTVENVVVRNCRVRTHCTALKLGTASHGTMRNVRFEGIVVRAPRRVYRDLAPMPTDLTRYYPVAGAPTYLCGPSIAAICVECVDGGVVEDVTFDDIDISGVCVPIHIRGGTRTGRECGIPASARRILRNVVVSNVRGRAEQPRPSMIMGVEGCRIDGVTLRNVLLECVGEGADANARPFLVPGAEAAGGYPDAGMFSQYHFPAYGLFVDHADNVKLENVRFTLRPGTTDARTAVHGAAQTPDSP